MNMKKSLQLTCLLLYASAGLYAATPVDHFKRAVSYHSVYQDVIKGTVKDETGAPLPGVTITIKGAQGGTQSNNSGQYSIAAKTGDVLVFSFIGYQSKEVTVGTQTTLDVTLGTDSKNLETVVVTALGIKRSEKSVTYSTQQLKGEELTKVKSTNLANSLNGKVAGLTISSSSSGVGGSAKVILRGSKSLVGSNQALYVIDGVPMNNTVTNQPGSAYGGTNSYDGGDPISNLNPDDIENISILKGASAAALYGSQGANGVIIVTTKSGKEGKTEINFSSGASFDEAAFKPEFQNSYGVSDQYKSWGAATTGSNDNLKSFFQTGTNYTNSISLSAGSKLAQTYISYANTTARGIQPNNNLTRNNLNFKEVGHFFNNKLTADASVNYVTQKIENSPLAGFYFNPLTGLYLFPRGVDITPYKNGYESLNPLTLLNEQNWIATSRANGVQSFSEDTQQNPWWIVNRNLNTLNRNRILLNGNLKYEVNSWFNIQARGSIDRINDIYDQKLYAGTSQYLAKANGGYSYSNSVNVQKYADLLANFNGSISEKFKITGVIGTSIRDTKTEGNRFASSGDVGLIYPNVFTLQNLITDPSSTGDLEENHTQFQSIFASANLAYNEALYLDVTARNDWASPLAFTKKGVSYFYPSVGANAILSQLFKLPKSISFAKIRASYAEVGNAPLAYQSRQPLATIGAGGLTPLGSVSPYSDLAPERTKSIEIGTEWRFFGNKLGLDFTYYKTNTHNQTLLIAAPEASFYGTAYLNAGNIQNQGIEFVASLNNILNSENLKWNSSVNFAMNRNKVIELSPTVNKAILSGASGANYQSVASVGGSFGDIYGKTLQRDAQGRIMIDADGKPIVQGGDFTFLGNPNPKWQLGWNNNFTYKQINLSFLVDGKFGGKVMSVTESMLDSYGVSKASGDARLAGGVSVNGVSPTGTPVSTVAADKWYQTVGGREGVSGEYMYSATTVRLREVALGYTFDIKNSFLRALKLSLTGRNLIYFYKKAPYDPELTMSTGNGLSGVDIFMPPATRSYGISLNANF
jgi:TonB-linked SusC/RagA family outer membrane protein